MIGKNVHIIGGGTVHHIRPHLALTAPAYGNTAKNLKRILNSIDPRVGCTLHLTKMAGGQYMETNEDVSQLIDNLISDPKPKTIIMNAALCDFRGYVLDNKGNETLSGKEQPRLKTSNGNRKIKIIPAEKVLSKIRKKRKDIFLVAFKTTAGATKEEQFEQGMNLLKNNSCNLVLANDIHTKYNMILTPEMASYGNTTNRIEALRELGRIVLTRSSNEFTRTIVIDDKPLSWRSAPLTLRKVVRYCIDHGAYKPFNGKTVGHFGYKADEKTLYSSKRKQNYNKQEGLKLALVKFEDNGKVYSNGGKPSAGARSQFELLKRYKQFNCVVHFHCPIKESSTINIRPQKYFECGSYQCGQNTADGIQLYADGKIGAVMLDKHGPNILFHKKTDPNIVISFIEENFILSETTK